MAKEVQFPPLSHMYFCNIFYSFFSDNNSSKCASQWLIIDRIVQQMVLQEKNGKDPDLAPVEINFTHIIRQ